MLLSETWKALGVACCHGAVLVSIVIEPEYVPTTWLEDGWSSTNPAVAEIDCGTAKVVSVPVRIVTGDVPTSPSEIGEPGLFRVMNPAAELTLE